MDRVQRKPCVCWDGSDQHRDHRRGADFCDRKHVRIVSSTSSGDQSAKLMIGLGCPVILVGGIFLIAKLAKGIARTVAKDGSVG